MGRKPVEKMVWLRRSWSVYHTLPGSLYQEWFCSGLSWDLSCSTSQKSRWKALSSILEMTTNWEQVVDMVEGRAAIQRYLNGWEEWTNRNLKKFSKGKYGVLHWKGRVLR